MRMLAVALLALGAGASVEMAVEFAILASGVVVGKAGNGAESRIEVRAAIGIECIECAFGLGRQSLRQPDVSIPVQDHDERAMRESTSFTGTVV